MKKRKVEIRPWDRPPETFWQRGTEVGTTRRDGSTRTWDMGSEETAKAYFDCMKGQTEILRRRA